MQNTAPQQKQEPVIEKKRGSIDHLVKTDETIDDAAIRLAREIKDMDGRIEMMMKTRTRRKSELRQIENKITTLRIQDKAS